MRSFGHYLVDNIFSKSHLTPDILARATGRHLGDFEWEFFREDGSPTSAAIVDLSKALQEAWVWGLPAFTQADLFDYIVRYETLPKASRDDFVRAEFDKRPTWLETVVTSEPDKFHGLEPTEWIRQKGAFTFAAFHDSCLPSANRSDARIVLEGMRWFPWMERVEGKPATVWRWNPLHVGPGRQTHPRMFGPKIELKSFLEPRAVRVKKHLDQLAAAGVTQVRTGDVCMKVLGKIPVDRIQQMVRYEMSAAGWVYHPSDKVWRLSF